MCAGATFQFLDRLLYVLLLAVRPVRRHGIEGVGDRDYSSDQRYGVPSQAIRITRAVVTLLMVLDLFHHIAQLLNRMKNRGTYDRVLFNLFEFLWREAAVFIQYVVWDANLAYIVQERRNLQRLPEVLVIGELRNAVELPGYRKTIIGDALRVAVRVWVAGVYCSDERYGGVDEYSMLADVKLVYLIDLLLEVSYELGIRYCHRGVIRERHEEPHLFAAEGLAGYLLAQYEYPKELALKVTRDTEVRLYQVHLLLYQSLVSFLFLARAQPLLFLYFFSSYLAIPVQPPDLLLHRQLLLY